jgi:4'-phosphopantetheinyl transferase
LLRHVLTRVVDSRVSPSEWLFQSNKYGKPMIANPLPQIEFSVSHSEQAVTVALSPSGAIGVDIESAVERDRSNIVYDALTDRERALLRQCPEDQQWALFIRLWTLKEACAKALGLGVTLDFHTIEVEPELPLIINSGELAGGANLTVTTTTISCGGRPYRLSVVKLDSRTS